MTFNDILRLLASIPPEAYKDAEPIIEEAIKTAQDAKAFMDKYPQIVEAFKKLKGGQ